MASNPQSSRARPKEVLVIGGGICGSTTAAVLAQAGMKVTLLDSDPTHQHHLAAALTPVISSDDNVRSRLSRLGASTAARYWQTLDPSIGWPCGAMQLQRPEGAKRVQDLQAQVQTFNQPDWACWVEREKASVLAGMEMPRGGIWFSGAWLVRVAKLIKVLQATPNVQVVNQRVARIERAGQHWQVFDEQGQITGQGNVAVLANAFGVLQLLTGSGLDPVLSACKRLPALHRLAGEVTFLPAKALAGGPTCIVGGDGYVLPAIDGWCVSGGTYVRGTERAQCSEAGRQANVTRAHELLGCKPELTVEPSSLAGWAGWRAVLPGRLPAIGQLPHAPDLWVFTAGASRGLTWSVLGATLIRDGLLGQPSALDADMLAAIEP